MRPILVNLFRTIEGGAMNKIQPTVANCSLMQVNIHITLRFVAVGSGGGDCECEQKRYNNHWDRVVCGGA